LPLFRRASSHAEPGSDSTARARATLRLTLLAPSLVQHASSRIGSSPVVSSRDVSRDDVSCESLRDNET